MIPRPIILLSLLAVAGCGHKELPPGYTMVCNLDGAKSFRTDTGYVPGYIASKSKWMTIQKAWFYHDCTNRPPTTPKHKGPWEECDK